MRLTGETLARAMGARVAAGDPGHSITGVSIDSRAIRSGELFFAIRGARFDGHRFAAAALDAGASAVVVSDIDALDLERLPAGVLVLAVEDTTRALQALARWIRRGSGAQVVAITGSAGKTTTKEVTAEFLSARYRVFRNRGNLNNHIGLPLSLLELRHRPEVAVVELGMNHPGEIRQLVAIAEPDVRVWTNVGDAHLGFFPSPAAIAEAKAEILELAGPSARLVANADDARVMQHARRFSGRLVTFGLGEAADVRAEDVHDRGLDGWHVRLRTPAGEAVLATALAGTGNLANVLAGVAVALEFAVPLEAIVGRAARLRPAPRRGEVLRLAGGVTVVDDSYNASPAALEQALRLIAGARGCARRVGVLGEMLELGAHAIGLHEMSGRQAAGAGLDLLIAVGGAPAAALAAAASAVGLPAGRIHHVGTSDEAAELAAALVRAGDLVLVKGSRAVAVDRVVDRLKVEFG